MTGFKPTKAKRGRLLWYVGGVIIITFILLIAIIVGYPELMLNSYVRSKLIAVVAEAYPGYLVRIGKAHYSFLDNSLVCDSIFVIKSDASVSCSVAYLSVSGIDRSLLVKGEGLSAELIAHARGDARNIVFNYHHGEYDLYCAELAISVADSSLRIDTLVIHPTGGDEEFFAAHRYRKTRFDAIIPKCTVTGVASLGLLRSSSYRARSIQLSGATLSILINKDKDSDPAKTQVPMPFDVLTSVRQTIHVDSIMVINSSALYGERFTVGKRPATLRLDSTDIQILNIGNTPDIGDTILLDAKGIFQNEAVFGMHMAMPIVSPELTYRYSGSMGRMHAERLNSFLEIAEAKRIKHGDLQYAKFAVNVIKGNATGEIRAVYRNFKIVLINSGTGSENGLGNLIMSFFANNIKLRTSNEPDSKGNVRPGIVQYTKKSTEAFFEFTWFSLRSGLKDLVGF